VDLLTIAVTTLLSAGVGSYLSGYFKKKGERVATQEDIEMVRNEVAVVTATTQGIQSQISHEFWEKQRTLELRRETLVELTKRIAALDDALTNFRVASQFNGPDFAEARLKATQRFAAASSEYDETRLLVDILCSKQLKDAADTLRLCVNDIFAELKRDATSQHGNSQMELSRCIFEAKSAIRNELGIAPRS
jgi:hypothetical protein